MFTITFYSFKGGVGRSLSLINVATELAKDGNNVAIIDFDLEAPGLQTYSIFKPTAKNHHPKAGLIEFIQQYIDSCHAEPKVPEIKDFLFEANKKYFAKFSDSGPLVNALAIPSTNGQYTSDNQGSIWLMPARGQKSKVNPTSIDWKKLYEEMNGFLLMEELKARISEETGADYLLIDSRTGLSDHSLICTNRLADALAVIYFPNIQNLLGLKGVMDDLRKFGSVEEEKIRFVASRIPTGDDEDEILRGLLRNFRETLHIKHRGLKLHQNSNFSLLEQEIFTLQRTKNTLLFRDYIKLTLELESLNEKSKRGTYDFLLRNLVRKEESDELEKVLEERWDVIKGRLKSAATLFLPSIRINRMLSSSLMRVANTKWGNEIPGIRDKVALHSLLWFGLELSGSETTSRKGVRAGKTKGFSKDNFVHPIATFLMSDYSFEQIEDATYLDMVLEQYGVVEDEFQHVGVEMTVFKELMSTAVADHFDLIASVLLIKNEDESEFEIVGYVDFYIVLILWRYRNLPENVSIDFTKIEYEIFNESTVRSARNIINRFYGEKGYAHLVQPFRQFAELAQTDIIDQLDYDNQEPIFKILETKGFGADALVSLNSGACDGNEIRPFLKDYVACICELTDGISGPAVQTFLDKRADTHTDFGRCLSRAIVHKISNDIEQYERAIQVAKELSENLSKKYSLFTMNGEQVDMYFSYLTLKREALSVAETELAFVEAATAAELISKIIRFRI